MSDNEKYLKGFTEHGVRYIDIGSSQARGVCPFCGAEKFFVNPESGLWDCKVCGRSGNLAQFLMLRMEDYQKCTDEELTPLSQDRGLEVATLRRWGCGYDSSSEQYMYPVGSSNIYRYKIGSYPVGTSGCKMSLMRPRDNPKSERVWVCEGFWDGVAWDECLKEAGVTETIYAVPGANSFQKGDTGLVIDKDVTFLFDADMEELRKGGGKKPATGTEGMRKAGEVCNGYARSLKFLHWKEKLKQGYDIRDLYHEKGGSGAYEYVITNLSENLPTYGLSTAATPVRKILSPGSQAGVHHLEVMKKFQGWLYLPESEVLSVMFGATFANRVGSDPLWMFLVAPPGGSKTEMLMTLSESEHVVCTSTLTPQSLISGANVHQGDPSLIPKLDKKMLIIKDFTTILQANPMARDEIFGILRDAYDGKITKTFGNGITRRYTSKFGILAGVTPTIESLSTSHATLGERFLKYRIRTFGHVEVGSEIIREAIHNLGKEAAMRTALKETAAKVLNKTIPKTIPSLSQDMVEKLITLAQLVAAARGAVTKDRYNMDMLIHKPVTEVGTRLAKELGALAQGVSVYHDDKEVTLKTFKLIMQLARDTMPDKAEEIIKQMYTQRGTQSISSIAHHCRFPIGTVRDTLTDLEMLHVVKRAKEKEEWRLVDKVLQMITRVGLYSVREVTGERILA